MNKKALYAVLLAVLLPLISYFIVKGYSDKTVVMPRHYFPDEVVADTVRGKIQYDTVWHRLADFTLVNQLGDSVTWDDMRGKIVIADFFFTHCPTICPGMTMNMKRLQQSIHSGQKVGDRTNKLVHFLSISVDPERDSVERLKYWADRFQIDPGQWWLLTGDKKAIYEFALQEIKVGLVDGMGVDTSFIHSDKFVLIDSNRHVRGYYDGLDSADLATLSRDIVMLTMEKDPSRKGFLAGKLELLAITVLVAILALGFFIFIIKKRPSDASTGMEKK